MQIQVKNKESMYQLQSCFTQIHAQEITRIPSIGQLAVGYHADFIVLDQDIFEISLDQIDHVRVNQTFMGGELVFQR